MVKAVWVNGKLVVTTLTQSEEADLPEWVKDSVVDMGVAVYDRVAYSSDEVTVRQMLNY
jgi:hypothetical protein